MSEHLDRVVGMTPEERLNYETGLIEGFKKSDAWAFIKVSINAAIAANHHRMMDGRVTANDRLLALASESRGLRWVIEFVETHHQKKEAIDAAMKHVREAQEQEDALRDASDDRVRYQFAPTVQ